MSHARFQGPRAPDVHLDDPEPAVRTAELVKRFGHTLALDHVSLDLLPGQVLGLAGHNGAGKSTLVKVLTGVTEPDEGSVIVKGESRRVRSRAEAEALGFGVVDQSGRLFSTMSVAENIWLGLPYPRTRTGRINWRRMERIIQEKMDELGVAFPLRALAGVLDPMQQRLAEITRALLTRRRMVLFDEATAALDSEQLVNFYRVLRKLKEQDVAVVLVSHFLDELLDVSDRIVVMREGRVVGDDSVDAFDRRSLFEAVAGISWEEAAHTSETVRERTEADRILLAADKISGQVLDAVSFELRAGEVIGLAGLEGSGKEEMVDVLAGMRRPTSGALIIRGQSAKFRSPRSAMRRGIVLLPRDRIEAGLFVRLDLSFNQTISHLEKHRYVRWSWMPIVDTSGQRAYSHRIIERLGIKATSPRQVVGTLSGGNQQKVLFGRVMGFGADVLVLNEPTEGVDVGAKREIMHLVGQLANEGEAAVVYCSNDPEELATVSTRVIVFSNGVVVGTLTGEDITDANILQLVYR